MKKVLTFMLLISVLLAGCQRVEPAEPVVEETSSVSAETEFTTTSPPPTESFFQNVQEETKPEASTEETSSVQITQPHTEKYDETADSESETEPISTSDKQTQADTPPATEAPTQEKVQEPMPTEESTEETKPETSVSEPTVPSQPVTEPTPEVTEGTEPEATQETEAETEPTEPFDIHSWVSFAQSYAQSIGLNLDSAAVDCWDNPITAGAHCIYLERDICSRLDRYNRDEDITDVWIWAVEIGNGCYDLYIGYA